MSVKFMKSGGRPERDSYAHGVSSIPLIDSPEICGGDRRVLDEEKVVVVVVVEKEKEKEKSVEGKKRNFPSSSSSTSSIGKNSDVSGKSVENSGDTEEVQSSFKGSFEAMDALEDVLPMRRGISKFYNGKSKSYASLSQASSLSSTIKDIAKPENAYMKRRRNLLACRIAWDHKNRTSPSLRCNNGSGISKKTITNTNSRTNALAFALTNSNDDDDIHGINIASRLNPLYEDSPFQGSSSSPRCRKLSSWRSFSMADLQQLAGSVPASTSQIDVNQS